MIYSDKVWLVVGMIMLSAFVLVVLQRKGIEEYEQYAYESDPGYTAVDMPEAPVQEPEKTAVMPAKPEDTHGKPDEIPSTGTMVGAHAESETLWQKAVQIAKSNETWMPQLWKESEKVYSKDGRLDESSEYLIAISLEPPDYNIALKVRQATKNDEDIREQTQAEIGRMGESYLGQRLVTSPLDPGMQENVVYEKGAVEEIEGVRCVVYDYKLKTNEEAWTGKIWLAEKSGLPVKVESTMGGLPSMLEGVQVKWLDVVTTYNTEATHKWYPTHVMLQSHFEMDYQGFLYKGKSLTEVELLEYKQF